MKITAAGIVKRIEFPNKVVKERYLHNLRIDGKNFYVISEGGNADMCFIKILETWRNVPLIKDVTTEL